MSRSRPRGGGSSYALRALFVIGLLAGLGIVWLVVWLKAGKLVGSVCMGRLRL
jgi:hypothetical protein